MLQFAWRAGIKGNLATVVMRRFQIIYFWG
jgi:hypothetical protein